MRSSRVEMVGGPVATALQRGASVKAAAAEGQLAEQTLRSWIRRGRESPDGPFGPIAAAFDGRRRRPRLSVVPAGAPGELPDRQELLELLAEQARAGSTTATMALLKEVPAQATADVRALTAELMASPLARPRS